MKFKLTSSSEEVSREKGVYISVNIASQNMVLHRDDGGFVEYRVSTAKKGVGQQSGSEQTPLGKHIIRARIGAGLPENTVFIGRRPTGEIYSPELAQRSPERQDWILSRILWLSGLEPGFNRLGSVDTMRRFIYIHGTPDSEMMGQPLSHGCIRMRNTDIIDLFQRVSVGTPVNILMK